MKEQLEGIGSEVTLEDFKVKDNVVVLIFDDFKLKILPETYEEFKFKLGTVYKKDCLSQVLFINDKYLAEKYLISKASKHMYSVFEAKKVLEKKFDDMSNDSIEAAIADLIESDVLDDTKYAKQYKDFFDDNYYGKYFVTNYLSLKQVDPKIINDLVFDQKLEEVKGQKYFELIKNKYVSSNIIRQKKKIYDCLLKRGFGTNISSSIVDSIKVDPVQEEKKLIKSYLKCKKKYENNKLLDSRNINDKVISHLVHEGYNYDDVMKVIDLDKNGDIKND